MPQAIDLAGLTNKSSAVPRRATSPEPKGRFDDVLQQQSRRSEQEDAPQETRQSEDPKPTRKAERKSKSEAEAPADEVEAAEPQDQDPAAESAPVDESSDETTSEDETADAPADDTTDTTDTDESAGEVTGEIDPALLASITQQAQTGMADDPAAEAMEGLDGVDAATTTAKAAHAKPIEPAVMPPTTPADSDGESELGGALEIPTEAAVDGDESFSRASFADIVKSETTVATTSADVDADVVQPLQLDPAGKTPSGPQAPTGPQPIPVTPERQFVDDNVDRIVSTVKAEISPTGGSMKIRLDPPNMGTLNVDVTVDHEGVLTASFQTSNDEAARLLSHTMQHLKNALETAGVTVDRIQVKQAAPSEQSSSQNSEQQDRQQNPQDHPARQDQQRREMLEKMWRKFALGEEPLDLVA